MEPGELTELSAISFGDDLWNQVELNIGTIDSPPSLLLNFMGGLIQIALMSTIHSGLTRR